MEHRLLGRTGVRVSELTLGTMMYGSMGNHDRGDCVDQIRAALDAGVNLVDTADVYSGGESEEIVGAAIAGRRDEVVLATKFRFPAGAGPNAQGGSRRWIMTSVERSLRRLGTDHIDLFQMHRPDPDCPIEETIGALADLVHQGKIRYAGCSTFPAEALVAADAAARTLGAGRFVSEQPPYSIFVREAEGSVFPVCRELGMGVLTWAPLAAGWLAGRYRRGAPVPADSRLARARPDDPVELEGPTNAARLDLVESLVSMAAEAGLTMTQLAIGFVLEHPDVTSAIIGPRTRAQLDDVLAAAGTRLPADVLDRIDELVAPGANAPGERSPYSRPGLSRRNRRRGV